MRHASRLTAEGAQQRAIRARDPRLAGVLNRELIGYRHEQVGSSSWLEPPRPELTLIVGLEGALTADGLPMPSAWLGGLAAAGTTVGVGSVYASIDLKLHPLGAYAVAGMPLAELQGGCVPLGDLFGEPADVLTTRLGETPDWDTRFDLVEGFLRARLAAGVRADPIVEWAWQRLVQTAGRIRITELVAEIGCSRRHLLARFRAQVGLGPKAVARLLRFADVRARIERRPQAWADIALAAGYADQSHLNREFRALVGVTPTEFVSRLLPSGQVTGD